jgi:hypothetical protein
LSVERKTRVSGGTTLEVDLLALVSHSAEVRTVEITPAVSVRLADRDVDDEVVTPSTCCRPCARRTYGE